MRKLLTFFLLIYICSFGFVGVTVAQTESVISTGASETEGGTENEGEAYQLLTDIPGFQSANTAGDFSQLINTLYKMSIGLGSVVAVLMIVFVGFKYATSSAVTEKVDLRKQLSMIIGGLVLLLGAYTFLELINPSILNLSDKDRYLIEFDFTDLEEFEAPVELTTNVVVPETPGQVKTYYVPVGPDGPIEGVQYSTEEECLDHEGAISCNEEQSSSVITGEVSGGPAGVAMVEFSNYGGLSEANPTLCSRIRDYAEITKGSRGWDCTASGGQGPWSAIFISFVMDQGGVSNFPKSTAHWLYTQRAMRGQDGMSAAPFGGSYQPRPGDLLCSARGSASGRVNYDNALDQTGGYPSHCDVVVENRGSLIVAIGGNVGNTIKAKEYAASGGVPEETSNSIAIVRI